MQYWQQPLFASVDHQRASWLVLLLQDRPQLQAWPLLKGGAHRSRLRSSSEHLDMPLRPSSAWCLAESCFST
jgi:hypothetical protein